MYERDENYNEHFAALYRRHRGELMNYFRAKLCDMDTAEDLTHDLFVKIYAGKTALHPADSHAGAYLQVAARHRYYDYASRKQNEVRACAMVWRIDSVTEDPAMLFERAELMRLLTDIIDSLPLVKRRVFMARYIHRQSLAEIARSHGMSEYLATRYARDAREELRRAVRNHTATGTAHN